jgi:hypothetical protein
MPLGAPAVPSHHHVICVTARCLAVRHAEPWVPVPGHKEKRYAQGVDMSTEFCQKCKQSHPGRLCDYNDQGECAETIEITPAQMDQPASASKGATEPEGSRIGHQGR